jgi:hypothetical protein
MLAKLGDPLFVLLPNPQGANPPPLPLSAAKGQVEIIQTSITPPSSPLG